MSEQSDNSSRPRRKIRASKVRSTAGAVLMTNSKGEQALVPVVTKRYKAGVRPEYAPDSDSDDDGNFLKKSKAPVQVEAPQHDRRLERLQHIEPSSARGRVREREAAVEEDSEEDEPVAMVEEDSEEEAPTHRVRMREAEVEEEEEESEDEDEAERRRQRLRAKAAERVEVTAEIDEQPMVEIMPRVSESEDSSSEYESSESEDDAMQLAKPVFVSKAKRLTVLEREAREADDLAKMEKLKIEQEKRVEETRKIAGELMKQEAEAEEAALLEMVLVDDDDDLEDPEEIEKWKVRELKRVKRDREIREQEERDRLEQERIREMTEEERQAFFKANPKKITNKAEKGKHKFMQKYYHRGAFYMDEEHEVLTRSIHEPTLDDHFDKSVLPKVMQVKKFGFQGRTKYTHLTDQDTTDFDSGWAKKEFQSSRIEKKRAGTKQDFARPSGKRQRKD